MPRPNVTLQPSKRTVSLVAAQIYSAYIAIGWVGRDEDAEIWIKRSVREAVFMAHHVDISVQSDEELPDNGKQRLRDWPDEDEAPEIAPPQ